MTPRESPKPTHPKNELISRSNYPESLKEMIESDLARRLQELEAAIGRARERLEQFEEKY